MKKLILPILLLLGCANNNLEIDKKIKETSIEEKLIKNYNISKNALVKGSNFYYFVLLKEGGIGVYKVDQNYNLIAKKNIKGLIEPQKLLYHKKILYLLSYDESKQKPMLIILDSNLNIKEKKYFAKKFHLPIDAVISNNSLTILLQAYQNKADIEICQNNKCKIFNLKDNQNPKFIKKFKDGYLIIGSNQSDKEDLLIAFVKNNKIVWKKIYDFGYSDIPENVKIDNKKIIIKLKSTDYMGAEKELTIILNDKGDIIKTKNKIETKPLPTKFRT